MVCKKVFQKLGTLAMAAVVVAAPVLAVNLSGAETAMASAKDPTNYAANSMVTTASGQQMHSALNGVYKATAVDGVAVTTSADVCTSAFGAEAKDVSMLVQNSDHGEKAEASLNHGLAQLTSDGVAATKGAVIDIYAYVASKKVVDIAAPIAVSVGVPADFQTAGYDYAVVRVQEGGKVSILPDLDGEPSTLTVATDGFGVFAIVKAPAGSFDKYR